MKTSLRASLYDYRGLRLSTLGTPRYRHVLLLLYWPVFGLLFGLLERGGIQKSFFYVHCTLDDLIPFCEWFLIPYLFWFVYLAGMLVYEFFFDVPGFRRYMYFVILTYTFTAAVYLLWPTAQALRPSSFPRDNALTRLVIRFYGFDTNTNVCPSIHVLGSVAVSVAAWDSPRFKTPLMRAVFTFLTALISVSTLFIKQHSVLDIVLALPVCAAALLVMKLAENNRRSSHGT